MKKNSRSQGEGLDKVERIDRLGSLRAVIETPRGSRNKYSHDSKENILLLKKVLPAGMTFPYDFGYIPKTKAQDGDPIDVLVLMDEPAFPGCVVQVRLIGVIEAEEKENGKAIRNDRLIAVAVTSHTHREVQDLREMGESFIKDLERFFETYQKLDGKEIRLLGSRGPNRARKLMEVSIAA
jgi:inorganic pyrophosphatase